MSTPKRIWTCDHCGTSGPWTRSWGTWGTLLEQEEGRVLVICSSKCRAACNPDAAWLKKYGEAPRKFSSYAGGEGGSHGA